MANRNQFHFRIKELSKILKQSSSVSFANDEEVLHRILNLLTENKSVNKIKGIISTTEIVTYGSDISDNECETIFDEILKWWEIKYAI